MKTSIFISRDKNEDENISQLMQFDFSIALTNSIMTV